MPSIHSTTRDAMTHLNPRPRLTTTDAMATTAAAAMAVTLNKARDRRRRLWLRSTPDLAAQVSFTYAQEMVCRGCELRLLRLEHSIATIDILINPAAHEPRSPDVRGVAS